MMIYMLILVENIIIDSFSQHFFNLLFINAIIRVMVPRDFILRQNSLQKVFNLFANASH